jgi:hypothetical protein
MPQPNTAHPIAEFPILDLDTPNSGKAVAQISFPDQYIRNFCKFDTHSH